MKAIKTMYHGPSNRRGSRISASDSDGNRVTISYDDTLNSQANHDLAAVTLCGKMGWTGELVSGCIGAFNVYVFVTPETIKIG